VEDIVRHLGMTTFPAGIGNSVFDSHGLEPVRHPTSLRDVLRRPTVRCHHLREMGAINEDARFDDAVECSVKYEGYVARQARDVQSLRDLESRSIPTNFAFDGVLGLSTEAREKLTRKRPETIGQASRIAGVRAADLSILAVRRAVPAGAVLGRTPAVESAQLIVNKYVSSINRCSRRADPLLTEVLTWTRDC
jgi:tRNA uridine 5-carboxymethylaminomethyl modification enzyme